MDALLGRLAVQIGNTVIEREYARAEAEARSAQLAELSTEHLALTSHALGLQSERDSLVERLRAHEPTEQPEGPSPRDPALLGRHAPQESS